SSSPRNLVNISKASVTSLEVMRRQVIKRCLLLSAVLIATRDDGAEAALVLVGSDKGTDHRAIIVRVAVVQVIQPEIVTCLIRRPPQVAKVLHQHERG